MNKDQHFSKLNKIYGRNPSKPIRINTHTKKKLHRQPGVTGLEYKMQWYKGSNDHRLLFRVGEARRQWKKPTLQGTGRYLSEISQKRIFAAFLMAQMAKNLPAIHETWVQSLGMEDALEKGMATHSSILAWRILWTEESGGLQYFSR